MEKCEGKNTDAHAQYKKHFFSQKPILSVPQIIGLDLVDN